MSGSGRGLGKPAIKIWQGGSFLLYGIIIPTLLSWRESVVVLDIKAENWSITAGCRQKHFGQKVLKFEPTNADGTAARFNPLSEVRKGTVFEIQDIQNLANIIVNPTGKSETDHWLRQEATSSIINISAA